MFLTSLAVAFFILFKVAAYYNEKYAGMNDWSVIGRFVEVYWRTSKQIPGLFFVCMLLCVWMETKNLEIAQLIATGILMFCGLSIICGAMMCIISTIEAIFGFWNFRRLNSAGWLIRSIKIRIFNWLWYLKTEPSDICLSYVTIAATLTVFITTLTSMTKTVIGANFL